MQKPSILLISCKLINLYQDVKLNWYSLSIKHIYSTRCRSNQYIWFLFFLFPINVLLVCLFNCSHTDLPPLMVIQNWRITPLKPLSQFRARALYSTLRTEYFGFARAIAHVARSLALIDACVLWSHQVSLKYWTCMHIIQTQPDAIGIIAMQRTNIYNTNFLQSFVYSQERCTIFKDSKIHWSCLCVCYTTMRLFLNVSNVILKRSTINVSVLFQFPCFATSVYILDTELFSTRYIFASIYGFVLSWIRSNDVAVRER